MTLTPEQRIQAIKDLWRIMYEQWADPIVAMNQYEREAKQQIAGRDSSGSDSPAR